MKTNIIVLSLILFLVGCNKETTPPNSTPIDITPASTKTILGAEGTVIYYPGGGTVELFLPPGFMIKVSRWNTEYPDSAKVTYLSGRIDSSYLNKRVRVVGAEEWVVAYYMFSNFSDSILRINVDSVQIIN